MNYPVWIVTAHIWRLDWCYT